jgi:glycosyltransferase involved in cell wall biosynthesis
MEPKLSVVVPALNAAGTIGTQLDALAAQEWSEPWEVLVVDNGSTDGTEAVVESYADRLPALRVVRVLERGQARALNAGVAAARAAGVAFCDADDQVAPGWVAAMGTALAQDEFVAGRADDERLNEPWQRAARATQPTDRSPTVLFLPDVPYAGSNVIGVRRDTHERLGGFDESMQALFDVDFSIRAFEQGIRLRFVPDAVVHYGYRDTWLGIFHQARSYGRANAFLQRKHRALVRRPGLVRWLLGGWKPIVRALPGAVSRGGRAKLAWLLGWQLSRYSGSLRYSVLAL